MHGCIIDDAKTKGLIEFSLHITILQYSQNHWVLISNYQVTN